MTSVHRRPWAPDCFVTHSGLVCSKIHTRRVCSVADAKAAYATTAIIRRIMQP